MPRILAIPVEAFRRFNADDGWAIASHIALSTLMAIFPFFILVTALAASLFGSKGLADVVADLILETWPREVVGPVAADVHRVLSTARGDVLTVGAVFALYFASSGIESLRIGLNRAYDAVERRNWFLLRLESIAYVLVAALALLALSFLIVLYPLIYATARQRFPWIEPLEVRFTVVRFGFAVAVIVAALVIAHKWLPAGRRRFSDIVPGIVATLAMWLATGMLFGRYLADFADTYVTYYAGMASVMIALVFLYFSASIFIYGGELNSVITQARQPAN